VAGSPTASPVPASAVIAISEGGSLPTRSVARTPSPSPTTGLAALIVPVQPFLTRTPGPGATATPVLVPPPTSSPRPTNTRPSGSLPDPLLTGPTRIPPPTRTPAPRGTFSGQNPEVIPPEPRPAGIRPPPDVNEPNDTAARATPLDATPIEAAIGGPDDVDVYRIDVSTPETLLVVTLTGAQANRYKVDVVAPRGGTVGRQRLDGTVALRAIADVGANTGTYYVFVRGVGRELPKGPYFISADVTSPAVTPTSTA
jgi:hypothetical protein